MCENCRSELDGRRDFLKLGVAGFVALGLGGLSRPARAAEGPATTLTPDEAIAALKSGNERYVNDPQVCTMKLAAASRRGRTASGSLGDDHQLCRQPGPSRTDLRRPGSR